ncbi:hypothetical protein VNI00_016608 [Paramarasmius palmivorus]|uniref:Major facilitator superfamily (MFS) profile domain-containing protein n=1 Tax=Paramarasmius palmivorus TaxID=297713 RepID=A0AAW0BCE2_9AGAR
MSAIEEKRREDQKEYVIEDDGGLDTQEAEFLANFPEEQRKSVLRRLDMRLMPMLTVLYLVSYIDRTNIGNTKIEGLDKDLGMTSTMYNVALSVFFVPYILFEIPANAILTRYFKEKPSIWIGFLTVTWGVFMTLHGIVRTYGQFLAVRLLLGLAEAGFFPGAVLLCSQWYKKNELQTRVAILFTASAAAGAFSGLLAFAIAKMRGLAGLEGWRWIFIIEGIVTVLLGLLVFFILVDSPARSTGWMTPDEIKYMQLRKIQENGGHKIDSKGHDFSWKVLWSVLTDWQIYLLGLVYCSSTVPNYALKFSMPTIIKGMGFTSANAQLMTIGPYTIGAISSYVFGRFSDRVIWRMPFVVAAQIIIVIGYSILFPLAPRILDNIGPCYFAVCWVCIGLYPIPPATQTWNSNNQAGPAKRSLAIAYITCMGNIGGIIGSYIFIDSEAPSYPTGYGCSLGFAAGGILAALVLEMAYKRINTLRDSKTDDEWKEMYSDDRLAAMGDRSPLFRYTL